MIIQILKKIMFYYKFYLFKRNAKIGKNIVLGRNSSISISDGSVKGNIVIGDNVMMFGRLKSENGGQIIICENTSIRFNTFIGASQLIEIGKNVIISNDVTIMDNNNHPVHPLDRLVLVKSGWSTDFWKWKYSISSKIKICDNVWVGQFARILKGVTIGENAIVAASAVVTKDVPPNSIVAGNPGRIVKTNIQNTKRFFV